MDKEKSDLLDISFVYIMNWKEKQWSKRLKCTFWEVLQKLLNLYHRVHH